jgi:hypothetical protein
LMLKHLEYNFSDTPATTVKKQQNSKLAQEYLWLCMKMTKKSQIRFQKIKDVDLAANFDPQTDFWSARCERLSNRLVLLVISGHSWRRWNKFVAGRPDSKN